MSSAIPFLNKNLPTDKDAELSVGVNAMAVKSAYDLEDSTEMRVLPGVFYDNNRIYLLTRSSQGIRLILMMLMVPCKVSMSANYPQKQVLATSVARLSVRFVVSLRPMCWTKVAAIRVV
jgi:hypothetical protein